MGYIYVFYKCILYITSILKWRWKLSKCEIIYRNHEINKKWYWKNMCKWTEVIFVGLKFLGEVLYISYGCIFYKTYDEGLHLVGSQSYIMNWMCCLQKLLQKISNCYTNIICWTNCFCLLLNPQMNEIRQGPLNMMTIHNTLR